jgi:two-component system nitrogen regulation sensor histidine kinase NtrY
MALIDRAQMTQVLTNLIQNAVDSIKERLDLHPKTAAGMITLEASRASDYISITCTDNGLGLPEKNRERLTEPYISTKKKGSGLGLAIVKKILEDHGGSIKLENLDDKKDQNHTFGARAIIVFLKAGEMV